MILAWQIERLSIMSQKKDKRQLPKLSELIDHGARPQTWQEMKATMKAILKGSSHAGDHTPRR